MSLKTFTAMPTQMTKLSVPSFIEIHPLRTEISRHAE